MHNQKYKTLLSNTFLLGLGTFGSKLLTFVMVRFYTGVLSPSDYGTADLIMQTANLLIPIASLGIANGVFRFALDRVEQRKSVFTGGLFTILLGSAVLLLVCPLLEKNSAMQGYATMIGAYTLASCLHSLCAQYVRAEGKTGLFALQGIINTALVIWFNILFLLFFKLGVTGYVLSVVAADGLCTLYLVLHEKLWRLLVPRPEKKLWKDMLRYSIPLIPTTIFWWITSVSDRYMIAYFLGTEANGLYAVACKIPTILTLLSTIFLEAWQFSAIEEATGDRQVHIRFYGQVWGAFLAAMVMAGSVLIVLCRVEIRLLSASHYFEAWKYVPVLSIAMVFSAFASFMGSVYVVTEKSHLSLSTTIWGALANIVLNLVLIPRIGIQGAAIATLCSYVLCFAIRAVSARELIPFPLQTGRLILSGLLLGLQTVLCFCDGPIQPIGQIVAFFALLVLNRKPFLMTVNQLLGLVRRRK